MVTEIVHCSVLLNEQILSGYKSKVKYLLSGISMEALINVKKATNEN